MFNKIRKICSALLMLASMVALSVAPAFAIDTTLTDIFTAANITGLNSNVGTLLIAFIAINVLFLGARYLRKAGVR